MSLTYAKELLDDFAVNKVLVIAPKRVAEDTWSREQEKWEHLSSLRVSKLLGTEKQRLSALHKDADIYVINRENCVWLVDTVGAKWPFDMVIIDELSSFKSAKSKRWRALKRVIKFSEYVLGLTGTPAPNGYIDLWPELFLIDGGEHLGKTLGAFRNTYFAPGARKGSIVYEWKLKPGAKEQIDGKLGDLCLSMSKEDWIKLPPLISNVVSVRMSREERALYEKFKTDRVLPLLNGGVSGMDDFDSAVVGGTAATLSGKLLQMANGAVYDDQGQVFRIHERKLDALEDIIEAANGQSVLVFYSYKHDLKFIKERINDAVELKDDAIERWNRGEIPVLLCHPASAGHGLNLQEGGHIAVWYGMPWSLELYQQAAARLHRMGQQERVIMHHIVCEGTLDEKVMAALDQKSTTQRGLLDALKEYMQHEKT